MFDRFRLPLGLAAIGLILGSGLLMGRYLIEVQKATISRDEWDHLAVRLTALETTRSELEITPEVSNEVSQIPINQADQNQLEELPGIGSVRAMDILSARQSGNFRDLADLRTRVTSIPKSVFEDISAKISFD